ncbi:hypothetical protein E2R68_01995 [Psychromonas sp. RZ22]|uniref:DUF6653 family protein n=1 Tax=Psychromonas algarum TaxID=2555643 RepID=UPI0010674145|nr:DUF6653 family protein [Psychromonas sp. RZ22]TEW56829.1 hypothetical protein E2R68_01995 [Psychromonas sp. RZ22]
MDIVKYAEKIMSMDDETWHRHSNPWSVYTRFTTLPLISFTFWSREWIDIYSIALIAISFLWVWLNPRLFSAPSNTNNWASMGTFGERIYINRHNEIIPNHHIKACRILQLLSAMGLPFFIYGLYSLNLWILILGNFWIMVSKAWFVDRMVWLYLDMKESNPIYQSWLKT